MNPSLAVRLRQRVRWILNRIGLYVYSAWMTATLAQRTIWYGAVAGLRRLAMGLTTRQVAAVAGLVALVVTPSVLFIMEHRSHAASKRAYDTLLFDSASETAYLRSSLRELLLEQARLTDVLLEAGHRVVSGDQLMVKVVATGYSSTVIETDDTPFITAHNTATREGILALSRDLLEIYTPGAPFRFGDRVHVSGLGEFIVEDSMNKRYTNRIDIWFPSREEAFSFGVREAYLSTTCPDYDVLAKDAANADVVSDATSDALD